MEISPYSQSPPFSTLQPSFGQCSVQTNDDPIIPIVTYNALPDNECMDTLAHLSGKHYGGDSLAHSTFMSLEESHLPLDCEMVPQGSQQDKNVVSMVRDDLHWKKIQEELMEDNSLTDLLLTGAEAIEAENWHLDSNVIARLDNLLSDQEKETNSFYRLAYYFMLGLRSRTVNSDHLHGVIARVTLASDMSAFQMVQELSPYVKFAHFTANQAILEAIESDREVHIIDFDVVEGIQWPPLMVDLLHRKYTSLWITAVTEEDNLGMVQRTGRRLVEFAESIGLLLRFDHMVVKNNEDIEGVEAGHGTVIINCITHQLRKPSSSFVSLKAFLGVVRRLSPTMVVMVEDELFSFSKIPSMSFLEFFCEAVHHFSALSDSLVGSFQGRYEVGLRLVEREMLGPRIVDCVGHFPIERGKWGCEAPSLEGFRAIPLSGCNVSQAKFLVGLFSRGYRVQQETGRLALCWNSRPLTTVSIWVAHEAFVGL